jgi:hypothetical protein
MDLSEMTDAELDALQLAVNVEIGARLQKSRMVERIADAMGSASSAGVPEADIATSFAEAKTRANIKYKPPVEPVQPVVSDKTRRRSGWGRSSSASTANTIDE